MTELAAPRKDYPNSGCPGSGARPGEEKAMRASDVMTKGFIGISPSALLGDAVASC
jgi:hypothetical protein